MDWSASCRRVVWASIVVAFAAVALVAAGAALASVAGSGGWKVQTSPNASGYTLNGAAATSATNAWVNSTYNGTVFRTLIEHWS